MPLKAFERLPAITWREANPAFVDLVVDTGMSTEIGHDAEIVGFPAFARRLAETEGTKSAE